jgi:hypothetical protein
VSRFDPPDWLSSFDPRYVPDWLKSVLNEETSDESSHAILER